VIWGRKCNARNPAVCQASLGEGDILWKVGTGSIIWIEGGLSKHVGGKRMFLRPFYLCVTKALLPSFFKLRIQHLDKLQQKSHYLLYIIMIKISIMANMVKAVDAKPIGLRALY
jgi:hypothetical protein